MAVRAGAGARAATAAGPSGAVGLTRACMVPVEEVALVASISSGDAGGETGGLSPTAFPRWQTLEPSAVAGMGLSPSPSRPGLGAREQLKIESIAKLQPPFPPLVSIS